MESKTIQTEVHPNHKNGLKRKCKRVQINLKKENFQIFQMNHQKVNTEDDSEILKVLLQLLKLTVQAVLALEITQCS